ncbi:glycosyltransferase family 4 protein [Rhodococcus sp. JS3073]|uniref:glycosyltransferase family 4 protein n=1 Tax=Rhodococcus sp. JS3073 TaxID=3002901 RepID=UPI003FA792F7
MRIAIVHSFYSSDQPSGENTVVESQSAALRRAGHEVRLVARHTDVESKKPLYKARALLSAANIAGPEPEAALDEFQPDVVHTHNLFPNWGTRWLDKWGGKTVSTLHNYRTICASGILWRDGHECTECVTGSSIRAIHHRCYRDSTIASVPLAWATRSHGSEAPTLSKSRSLIVLNAKALETYRALLPTADLNLIPNFAEPTPAVTPTESDEWIYVGRLVPEKGLSWLLEHWPRDRRLVIVGAGELERDVAQAADREPRRFRFRGRLTPEETRQAIANAKGLLLPSLWAEGIPTVALEALQCGTPVLVSDRCASARELTAGGAGLIFSLDAGPDNLSNAISAIDADQGIRARASLAYRDRYSEAAWVSRVENVYTRIMSQTLAAGDPSQ